LTGIAIASILVLGVLAQWLAWRLRVPSILVLLLTGLLVGPVAFGVSVHVLGRPVEQAVFLDIAGLIGEELLLAVVSLAVSLILFEGALTLNFSEIRQVRPAVLKLVTIGALVTWVVSTLAARYILGLGWPVAILLGAILIVTGPTVIGPLLRFVRPIGSVGKVLKWEGIVIDPIGALVVVLVFEAIRSGSAVGNLQAGLTTAISFVVGALLASVVGSVTGLAAAAGLVIMLRRYMIPDHLQVPVTIVMVLAAFSASNFFVHESGLFATTIMGIALANQRKARISHIHEFKETLTILLIAMLFIVLAARLRLEQLAEIWAHRWGALGFLLVLLLVARPAGVFLSTIGTRLNVREKLFLSWMAPRGIVAASVSSVFGLALVAEGVEGAELLTPYVFLTIVATVALYGLTAVRVATRLGVANPANAGFLVAGANELARAIARALQEEQIEVLVVDLNPANIRRARLAGLQTMTSNILSPQVSERIELTGIGRLLALTPNDEINSLAAVHFARNFGRSNVYQLAFRAEPERQRGAEAKADVHEEVKGRPLFGRDYTYSKLQSILSAGGQVRRTKLTREFTHRDWEQHAGGERVPLFLVDESGALSVFAGDRPLAPRPGQAIISLSVPSAEPPAMQQGRSSPDMAPAAVTS
jgi:NhaP-type Na+/H+ or K+/H+ antiporter